MNEEVVNIEVVEDKVAVDNPDIGNSVSWDDLESLTETQTTEEALADAKQEEIKEETTQDQPPLESISEEETTEENETEGEEETETEEQKFLTAKLGDEETEIASDSTFAHKVEGNDIDVSLQDLLNNYSGKVPYDKRFQELSTERQEFENIKKEQDEQITQVNNYINNFAAKMKENDALGAMSYLAEFAGMKPHDFKRQLIEQVIPEVKRISSMSREEYELEVMTAENEYLRQQHESAQEDKSKQQARTELHKRIQGLQETYGLQEDDFRSGLTSLQDSDYDGEITPEIVADYCVQVKAFKTADEVINSVDPSLIDSEVVRFDVQKLVLDNPDMSQKEYTEILKGAVERVVTKASKSVSKKIRKGTSKKKPQKDQREYEKYSSFEDL